MVDPQAIEQELAGMSKEQLIAELRRLAEKRAKQRASRKVNAEARKAYYEKVKNTPEWKEARRRQAEARKAKIDALLKIARQHLSSEELEQLGL